MKKLLIFVFFNTLFFQLSYSQHSRIIIDVPSQQKPWNTIEWNNNPDNFQFAIVTDRTGGHRPGIFMKAINKLNLLQPEFVMSVGDLIEGYTKDTTRLNTQWKEFNGFIKKLEMPFFYVPGNHDITNAVMEKKWEELFGVKYYHFIYKDVLFLCLNSEDNYRGAGNGMIGDGQYEYIKRVLDEHQDVKWTLVFLHQPLWVQEDTKRWKDVEKLLQDRPHNVFAGHYHRYWKTERNNGKYIALATTGGASKLRGTAYGEFDHVVWATMTKEGPLLTNLLLDGIWDENVVTEEIVDLVRNHPFPVVIEPLYIDNNSFKELTTPIRITNNSDYRMRVKIEGLVHPDMFYSLDSTNITVEPNDVATLHLKISNPKGIDISKKPIQLQTEVTYDYKNRTDLILKNMLPFLPFPKEYISRNPKKIKVDGKLKEWNTNWTTIDNYKGGPFNYTGADDCSLQFATAYDDENLYIAVNIIDDNIVIDENASLWQQDALIIGLDARSQYISAGNVGEDGGKEWLLYFRSFKENDPIYHSEALPKEVTASYKTTDKGISLELAIPISYLDAMQKQSWKTVRLGIGYYDVDKGQKRTQHFWYPSWDSKKNIPGSGMLFKK